MHILGPTPPRMLGFLSRPAQQHAKPSPSRRRPPPPTSQHIGQIPPLAIALPFQPKSPNLLGLTPPKVKRTKHFLEHFASMAASALAALSATAAAAAGKRLLLSPPSSSSLSFASRRLAAAGPLRAGLLLRAPRRAASVSAPLAAATIAVGDRLPDATLSYFDSPDGELKTVTVRDLTAGKKVVLFAVPGAFTPTCTQKHLPGFVAKAGELRDKGVDVVACVSVNDAFVMRAWKESLGVGDEVLLLSDGNGELTRAMGVELDLSDKPVGLGVRSRRYALLAEDGVVKVLNLEEGGAFTNSSAEEMLKAL